MHLMYVKCQFICYYINDVRFISILTVVFFSLFQQSKYNIQEYKVEKAYALAPYIIKKFPPPKNNSISSNDVGTK